MAQHAYAALYALFLFVLATCTYNADALQIRQAQAPAAVRVISAPPLQLYETQRAVLIGSPPPFVLSTPVKAPPRRKTDTERSTPSAPPREKFVIKERRSIADEVEAYFAKDDYLVILYNDEFNKRLYVLNCLMQVFGWDENRANAVMMAAHTAGAVVAHECDKTKAFKYVDQMRGLGLVADARPANGGGSDAGGDGSGGGGPSAASF